MNAIQRMTDRTFLELEQVHAKLDELFLRHQEALVARQYERALTFLDTYEQGLRTHIHHEEQKLLPLYEQRRNSVAISPSVAANVFSAEHARMVQILGDVRVAVAKIAEAKDPTIQALIDLLDFECTFKRLVEHHNTREHNVLYPCLDQITLPPERHHCVERCIQESTALNS